MEEGGVADKTEFTECWRRTTESPYIMRLALSAGIGGLLFGYDTGKKKLALFNLLRRHVGDCCCERVSE